MPQRKPPSREGRGPYALELALLHAARSGVKAGRPDLLDHLASSNGGAHIFVLMTGLFDRLRTALVDLGMGWRRVTGPGAAGAAETQFPAGSLTWLTEQLADRYVIAGQIGAGGMALVFRADDVKHQRNVAVKIMRPELSSQVGRERFLREIQLVARLSHPHILPLYDSGEVAGLLYFVMPYVEGGSLRDELREGPLPVEKATGIARAVATALDYAHRHEVVHRDIKPENIMLHEGVAMVADFGIGKALSATGGEQLTQTGAAVGTAAYMSPEQIYGAELDGRSDIYSLACVLYEMVTGTRLFTGPTLQALIARRMTTPMPELDYPETVPRSIRTAIREALAEAPADRTGTADQFADALTRESAAPPQPTPVTHAAASSEKSIAVLPFANMSPDAEAEYFSDGITEEIINALAHLPGLRVAARTSCFAFKGRSPDLAEVREKLNVGVVLEGSVRKVGDRLRLTAQLVNAADGFHLWSERYDRELTDVLELQDELTDTIVAQLGAHLGLSGTLPKRGRAENLAAYDLYLRGKFHSNLFTYEGYQKAVKCYEQATEADPGYAAAYAALADVHAWFGHIGGGRPSEIYPRARTAALRALELDAGLAEAHSALGYIRFAYDWDWAGAEDEFKLAIALNPNSATAHHQYSIYLGNIGRLEEAIAVSRQSVRLDPLWVAASQALGLWFVLAQQYDEGRIHLERALDLDPNFPVARIVLAVLYVKTQMPEKAVEECERAVSASRGAAGPQSMLGYTYAVAHRTEEARSVLATLENLAQRRYVSAAYMTFVYIGLGEHDEAFRWLDTAFAERAGELTWLPTWPVYDSLREDPRFTRLLQRTGLDSRR